MTIAYWVILAVCAATILASCGQQRLLKDDNDGTANLQIEDITCNRVSTIWHDQYGRTIIGNEKRFSFTITAVNMGTADFVGLLSVSNTRSDLNKYEHTVKASTEPVRIHVGETITIISTDGFSDFVEWVRFRLEVYPSVGLKMDSLLEQSIVGHFKEIHIPDR